MKKFLVVVALIGVAHADDKKSFTQPVVDALGLSLAEADLPPLVLIDSDTKEHAAFIYGGGSPSNNLLHVAVGVAADDKQVGWVAADSGVNIVCGMPGCDKVFRDAARADEKSPPYHHTAVVDHGKVLFLHAGATGKGVGNGDIDAAPIPADAKPVVDQFQAAISAADTFAGSVSARKDALMYGTEPNERFVGGAAIKATLKKWNLALAVHGNLRAGVTSSKSIAWIAADVTARSPKSKEPTPYRLTVVYEKSGTTWSIVQIHFS